MLYCRALGWCVSHVRSSCASQQTSQTTRPPDHSGIQVCIMRAITASTYSPPGVSLALSIRPRSAVAPLDPATRMHPRILPTPPSSMCAGAGWLAAFRLGRSVTSHHGPASKQLIPRLLTSNESTRNGLLTSAESPCGTSPPPTVQASRDPRVMARCGCHSPQFRTSRMAFGIDRSEHRMGDAFVAQTDAGSVAPDVVGSGASIH